MLGCLLIVVLLFSMMHKVMCMKVSQLIQGGMGIGVSDWKLARSVCLAGQTGFVSSTAIDLVLVRRLQEGDTGGDVLRGLSAFPDQQVAERLIKRYYIEGGKAKGTAYVAKPMVSDQSSRQLEELIIAASFVEVYLAKEGHDGMVGVNFIHKIQSPLLPALYGAMLAGVDIVAVGAGIPLEIPKVIDGLCQGLPVQFTLHVHEAKQQHYLTFNPQKVLSEVYIPEKRPLFFPIVSSVTLATMLVKKSKGKVDGLIIEAPSAGGHNAPPRGALKLDEHGEPEYGKRDEINIEAIKSLGVPFWLAGSYGSPENFSEALASGAQGVQLGTLFAFCEESGLRDDLKLEVLKKCQQSTAEVYQDPVASPTGFPFQVLSLEDTISEQDVYKDRCRQCDLGYLREAYERSNGRVGWRCKAEDPQEYVKKGGRLEDTVGRKCLCNSLAANIGLAQVRKVNGSQLSAEPPLITCGKDLSSITTLLGNQRKSYKAAQVIDYVLG